MIVNNIIKSAADKAGMFVYINPQKSVQTNIIQVVKGILIVIVIRKEKHIASLKSIIIEYVVMKIIVIWYVEVKSTKRLYKKQFNEFQKSFVNKLRGLRTSDPKAYWSLLNKGCDKSKTVTQKVALNVIFNHFKELSNMQNDVDIVLPDNISECNTVINE